jgi:hypothetical protein
MINIIMKSDEGSIACAIDREIAPINRKRFDMTRVVVNENRKNMKK